MNQSRKKRSRNAGLAHQTASQYASRRAGEKQDRNGEKGMVRIAVLGLSLIVVGVEAGCAQDIAGIEDCTKTSGLDKRTGCLQSNVNFLQRLVTKNALDARNKLDDAASEIVALKGASPRRTPPPTSSSPSPSPSRRSPTMSVAPSTRRSRTSPPAPRSTRISGPSCRPASSCDRCPRRSSFAYHKPAVFGMRWRRIACCW
jgi:hypothetical protein